MLSENKAEAERVAAAGVDAGVGGRHAPWRRYEHEKKGMSKAEEATLNTVYAKTKYPSDAVVDGLWDLHGLRREQVIAWFAARRREERGGGPEGQGRGSSGGNGDGGEEGVGQQARRQQGAGGSSRGRGGGGGGFRGGRGGGRGGEQGGKESGDSEVGRTGDWDSLEWFDGPNASRGSF
jgi:hypothetical protein